MLKTKTKKKKKFKIVAPIKEAQIIDYIPEKKNDDEILEGDIPDEDDYLNGSISDDEEDNIQILEEKLFNNDDEDDSQCVNLDILSKPNKAKTNECKSLYSYGDFLETEVYNY